MVYTTTIAADSFEKNEKRSVFAAIGRALTRIRFQLLGGIFFAVAAPALIRGNYERFVDDVASYENSLVGTLCALIFGFMIFRKVTALPGPGAILRVVPAFLLAYGTVAIIFFVLRLDYSRYQFLMSLALVIGWFLIVLLAIGRARKPLLALVPGGAANGLTKLPGARWRPVETPEAAAAAGRVPLVVDLKNPDLSEEWERYIAEAAISGRPVFNAKQLAESLTGRVQVAHLSENTFGHLSPDSIYAPAKRYIDAITAFIGLLAFSPVLILTAIAVKATSRGPIIFRQKRMGYRGKVFTVWKFRSMREARPAGNQREADITKSDDERITAVGRVIRKTRIDELPQMVNILMGQMSWIGPRPETLRLSEWYESEIPFYRYRHIVRPGISGWAQVRQGHVADVDDVREKLEYDLYYVKHFSIWLDLLIVMHTIRVVLTGHGAK
jgi:lipopolysaccharide/colanic/teichoic acid biosynthesis glycosyltransferase